MICLIHETFIILDLIIKLFLDIVLHLVRYEPACNLVGHLAEESEVIGREILIALFIGHFKDTDCMVTKLYWNEKYIANWLMKLLVHGDIVITKLFSHALIHSFLKVSRLSCIEDLAEYVLSVIWRLSLETHGLSESSRDHFTEQLIFDTIV